MRAVDDRLWQGVIASMSATCYPANTFGVLPVTQPPEVKSTIATAAADDCAGWA